jgi:hypothetical protein
MASHPSFTISGTRAKAATGSAHDFPKLALVNSPASAILHPGSYDCQFIQPASKSFADNGYGVCH